MYSIWQTSGYPICSVQAKRFSVLLQFMHGSVFCWDATQANFHSFFVLLQMHFKLPLTYNAGISNVMLNVLVVDMSGQQQLMFWVAVLWLCRYTYRHDQVLSCLVSGLSDLLAGINSICIYADLRASKSPLGTVPSSLMVTSYCPDIVIHNVINNTVALLELTCPLDSTQHLEAARNREQSKQEYLQVLSELDRLEMFFFYDTIEVSVLGHYFIIITVM